MYLSRMKLYIYILYKISIHIYIWICICVRKPLALSPPPKILHESLISPVSQGRTKGRKGIEQIKPELLQAGRRREKWEIPVIWFCLLTQGGYILFLITSGDLRAWILASKRLTDVLPFSFPFSMHPTFSINLFLPFPFLSEDISASLVSSIKLTWVEMISQHPAPGVTQYTVSSSLSLLSIVPKHVLMIFKNNKCRPHGLTFSLKAPK